MLRKKVEKNDDEIDVLEKKLKRSENMVQELKNKVNFLCDQQTMLVQNQDNILMTQNVLENLNMGDANIFVQRLQFALNALLDEDGNPFMLLSEDSTDDEGGG